MSIYLLVAQLVNFTTLGAWLVLVVMALLRLRNVNFSDGVRLGWTAVILLVPVLGALAFLLQYSKHRHA